MNSKTTSTLCLPSPLQPLVLPGAEAAGLRIWIKRDDLIHPELGGNKWRKLSNNLEQARSRGATTLLTFGGRHANHLYATSAAGRFFGFKTIGIVRGEAPPPGQSPTLDQAAAFGMHLHFVSRTEYREKHRPEVLGRWLDNFGRECYVIPEGGTNLAGMAGCREIVREVSLQNPDLENPIWCVPCGTGGTLAGIAQALPSHARIIGIAALKGSFLDAEIHKLLPTTCTNWKICHDYHFGGYARYSPELIAFMRQFSDQTGIPLDPIYTAKMMYGLTEMIRCSTFKTGTDIVVVHTGGLQGNEAFERRYRLHL